MSAKSRAIVSGVIGTKQKELPGWANKGSREITMTKRSPTNRWLK
jgi:hypothetical protein